MQQNVILTKYSFHWQSSDGRLIARWDNAPHYPHLPGFPHHVHSGPAEEDTEETVQPHAPMTLAKVLDFIAQQLQRETDAD